MYSCCDTLRWQGQYGRFIPKMKKKERKNEETSRMWFRAAEASWFRQSGVAVLRAHQDCKAGPDHPPRRGPRQSWTAPRLMHAEATRLLTVLLTPLHYLHAMHA
jgi:hypothetical protein